MMTPQNYPDHAPPVALHVAIIMDGNGRWAKGRKRPRFAGHRAGAEVVRHIAEAAPKLGISTLTLYAFSADNWQRPVREVNALMRLFHFYLHAEAERCIANGVRVSIIGRSDRLTPAIRAAIEQIEAATRAGEVLHLRLAIDYSARDAIVLAARKLNGNGGVTRETFSRALAELYHAGTPAPDVDLLIRTGGEQRLSDFLLWECAYAELYFTPVKWPDFQVGDLEEALYVYKTRERRFGRVSCAQAV